MKQKFRDILLYLFVLVSSLCSAQEADIERLKLHLKNSKQDTTRLVLLLQLSEICKTSEIISYAEPAIKLADELLAKTSGTTTTYLLKKKAIAINNVAYQYTNLGNISKGLAYYDKGLKIQQQINDKYGMARSFNDIGYIYNEQGDLNNALIYYTKALKIREAINDTQGVAQSFINIGTNYLDQNNKAKALECFLKSLKLHETIGDKLGIAHSLNNLGLIYKKNDRAKALDCYTKSLKILYEIGSVEGILNCYNNLGAIYFNEKKFSMAFAYCDSSLILSKRLGLPDNIKNAERALYKIDSAINNTKGAFEHYKLYILYRDSINNEDTRKASIKSQLKYEFEKKEAVIKEQQEKERVVAEEKNRFQKIIIASVLAGLILVIVFALFVFRSLKITRHQKIIIEEKHKEILDSIHYAKRIQTSLLPTEKYIDKNLRR
ncbi:MAG: tetratricopeptide repeat protein [Bacteroidetes bacterium]|nr:tetratricopeptide repeat protein [Bacteroidota bacterium]